MKIVKIAVTNEDGTVSSWEGTGKVEVIKTKEPVTGKPVKEWSDVKCVYVNLFLS